MHEHPGKVVEAPLAHVVRNKVEAAYRRSDLFKRRRWLMEAYPPRASREPSAARTMIALSPMLAHEIQRPRNVSASVL